MSNFPPLRLAVLTGLLDLKGALPSLDTDACPYDEATKDIIKKLLAPTIVKEVVEKEIHVEAKAGRGRPSKDVKLSQDDQQMVLDEIKNNLDALTNMGTGEGLPTNERIQIAKTKANLLEQMLKMMERHTAAQKTEQFKETVINILEDLVSEKDRDLFLRRLEAFR